MLKAILHTEGTPFAINDQMNYCCICPPGCGYEKMESGSNLQQIPRKDKEREVLYVPGASGSGKSYYAGKWAEEYQKMFPTNKIFLFSLKEYDPAYDKVRANKMKVDESVKDYKINFFPKSLLIFDDFDGARTKQISDAVHHFITDCLFNGRSKQISLIITTHIATNGQKTKIFLSEATSITIFPLTMPQCKINYLLQNYVGMDKNQIADCLKKPTRWLTILMHLPRIAFNNNVVFTI